MSNWFLFCEVWCKVKIVLVIGWKEYKLLKIPDKEKQGDPPQWPPIQKQTCPEKKGVVKNFSAVHIDFTFILAAHPGGGSFSRLTISLEILFSELLLPDIFNTIFVFFPTLKQFVQAWIFAIEVTILASLTYVSLSIQTSQINWILKSTLQVGALYLQLRLICIFQYTHPIPFQSIHL